jgi:hypothetical protein
MNRLLSLEKNVKRARASLSLSSSLDRRRARPAGPSRLQALVPVRRRRGHAFDVPKHTFKDARIAAMKAFLQKNASGTPMSCIATMNEALRIALDRADLSLKGEVHTSMEALRELGLASGREVIEFLDKSGKQTTGVTRPDHLPSKIADGMLALAQQEAGWSLFGLSLMDGYHSVLISLDNSDSTKPPKIYWSDQWQTKGGWLEYSVDGLNDEVTRLIQAWWDKQPSNGKSKTRVSYWRVLGTGP